MASSSSFEVSQQDDDWMDVTAREDLLQRELNQVKTVLEQRSEELEAEKKSRQAEQEASSAQLASVKEVVKDLLSKKVALENENKEQSETLAGVSKNLEESYAWNKTLQDELADLRYSADELRRELNEVRTERDGFQSELAKTKKLADERAANNLKVVGKSQKDLKEAQGKVKCLTKQTATLLEQKESLERLAKNQKEIIDAANKTSQTIPGRAAESQRELSKLRAELQKRTKEATEASSRVSTLAVYAEELKADKLSLQRTLKAEQKSNADLVAVNRSTHEQQIGALKGESLAKVKDLEEALRAARSELETAREEKAALEEMVGSLNKKVGQLETKRKDDMKKLQKLYQDHKAAVMTDMLEEETFTEVMEKGILELRAAFKHAF